jgi:hypothetical protein
MTQPNWVDDLFADPDPFGPGKPDVREAYPAEAEPGTCVRCGEPESAHCSDCGACYDHAGWCPSDPDNKTEGLPTLGEQEGGWF